MSELTLSQTAGLFGLILRFRKLTRDEAWKLAENTSLSDRNHIWKLYKDENYESLKMAINELS